MRSRGSALPSHSTWGSIAASLVGRPCARQQETAAQLATAQFCSRPRPPWQQPVRFRFGRCPFQTFTKTRGHATLANAERLEAVGGNGLPSDRLDDHRGRRRSKGETISREAAMVGRLVQVAKSAYQHALIWGGCGTRRCRSRRIRRSSIAFERALPTVNSGSASDGLHPRWKSPPLGSAIPSASSTGAATAFSKCCLRSQ
jgi:hypothetical protein